MAADGLKISELLEACAAELRGTENLAGLEVIAENQGDLLTRLKTALAKTGCCAVIGAVLAENKRPNVSKPLWLPISFTATIFENVTINRASPGALSGQIAAERIAEALHHFNPGAWGTVTARRLLPVEDDQLNRYEVEFQIGE